MRIMQPITGLTHLVSGEPCQIVVANGLERLRPRGGRRLLMLLLLNVIVVFVVVVILIVVLVLAVLRHGHGPRGGRRAPRDFGPPPGALRVQPLPLPGECALLLPPWRRRRGTRVDGDRCGGAHGQDGQRGGGGQRGPRPPVHQGELPLRSAVVLRLTEPRLELHLVEELLLRPVPPRGGRDDVLRHGGSEESDASRILVLVFLFPQVVAVVEDEQRRRPRRRRGLDGVEPNRRCWPRPRSWRTAAVGGGGRLSAGARERRWPRHDFVVALDAGLERGRVLQKRRSLC